jgi:threonine aldolase
VRLLNGDRGRISVEEISPNINNIQDAHQPLSTVVALENTIVREAGSYYKLDQVAAISQFARSRNLKMHLDGARLFNALTETGEKASDFGKYFDTISICLSKGLGAPVGSVLLYKREFEAKARRLRKAFGGGMRQAGFLAAAGIYALDNHVSRLKEDHARARKLGDTLKNLSWVKSVMPVDTNIVIFEVQKDLSPEKILAKFSENQIKALPFSATDIRLVTHLDFTDAMLDKCLDVFSKIKF